MTADRNKINSFALMYGSKITPEQANESLSNISIFFVEANLDWIPENVHEALDTLREFVKQSDKKPKVKVVYEYKLRDKDGKYLDRSNWSEKGKTYKNKAALMSALGTYISERVERDPNRPKFDYHRVPQVGDAEKYQEYRIAYTEWRTQTQDRNIRASYLPEDWIVIAIAVNTAQEPKEMDARTWYSKLKKPEDA